MRAASAYNRVVAFFQRHDKVVAAGFFRHRLDLFVARAGSAKADVVAHAHVEQEVVLAYVGHAAVVFFKRKVFYVHAADFHAAGIHVPKRGDQARQC